MVGEESPCPWDRVWRDSLGECVSVPGLGSLAWGAGVTPYLAIEDQRFSAGDLLIFRGNGLVVRRSGLFRGGGGRRRHDGGDQQISPRN